MLCMAKRVGARRLTDEQQATAVRIGKRYEDRRAELGLTQTGAANRLARHMPTNYSQHSSTVSRLERGLHWPDVYVAAALARAYGKTLEEMAPELVPEAQRMGMFLAAVVDLTECAPWELNPQPAERDALPGQLVFAMASAA